MDHHATIGYVDLVMFLTNSNEALVIPSRAALGKQSVPDRPTTTSTQNAETLQPALSRLTQTNKP